MAAVFTSDCTGEDPSTARRTGSPCLPNQLGKYGRPCPRLLIAKSSLLAKPRFYGNSLAPFGPAPGDYRSPALRLHSGAETVRLRATAAVGLECSFRHEKSCAPVLSKCSA